MKDRLDEPGVAALYDAVAQFRDRCLRELTSVFLDADDPLALKVWTEASAEELIHEFIDKPDEGHRTFIEKLRDQLTDASPASLQLLVELTWLHLVISIQLKPETKKKLLAAIAAIGDASTPTGSYLAALDDGIVRTGTSYSTRRPNSTLASHPLRLRLDIGFVP